MEPYTDVASHVRDELRRAWLRLEYEIRIGWRRAIQGSVAARATVSIAIAVTAVQ
jgi:hypothetical protein